MRLDNKFWGDPSETPLEELLRLREGLYQLRKFHHNAVNALDYMCHLDPNLASPGVIRMLTIPIMGNLEEPLGLGTDFISEHAALERSIKELNKRVATTHDVCLSELCSHVGPTSLESFRKLDSALLSPISILDFLLAEISPTASAKFSRDRAQRIP